MKNILTIGLTVLFLWSCANFVAPTGGAQDKNAPQLINSNPQNQEINFKGKEITLEFDELIDAADLKSQLTITPKIEKNYDIKVKNNIVKLKFEEEFKDSTTYALYFKNSIKDLSEKNIAKNLKLVFSTYNKIDSLELKGNLQNIYTKEPIENAIVGLYPYDTLNSEKKQPLYFSLSDSLGNYKLENIKNGKYKFVAFVDKNNNIRYDQETELLGFVKDSIDLNTNIQNEQIEMYKADYTPIKIRRSRALENAFTIQLSKPAKDVNLVYENEEDSSKIYLEHKLNQIIIHKLVGNQLDTIKTQLILTDSLLNKDTLSQKIYFSDRIRKQAKKEILRISSDISNNQILTREVTYEINFQSPIKNANLEKIEIKGDTIPISNFEISKSNHLQYKIKTKLQHQKQIELIIPSNTFENMQGDTNTTFRITNSILQDEDLGLIEGSVKDTTNIKKIAVLTTAETNKEIRKIHFEDKFLFEKLIPGEYKISIIFDENENGIWDPGNIKENKEPEKLLITKNAIRVRSNYEIRNIIVE